jgi:pimeloyl-ACP methyl ester carboxylesterase
MAERAAPVELVLLHGQFLDRTSWGQPFLDALAPHDLTLLDLAGHGAVELAPLQPDFDAWVDQVREQAGPARGRRFLLGHSLGAWIAARWAQRHADVDGCVLIGCVTDLVGREAAFEDVIPVLEQVERIPGELATAVVATNWLPGRPDLQGPLIERLAQRPAGPAVTVMRGLLSAPAVALDGLDVATIRGADDPMAARYPDDRIIGQSHFPFLEDPQAVAAEVHRFVGQLG